VAARQPAHPVAEHRAGDARAAVEPGGRRQAEERGRIADVRPARPGPHPGAVGADVELDARQCGRAQQHAVVERAEASSTAAAALGDDAQAALTGVADGCRDLALVGREGDQRRALVDGEVERATSRVPARVAGFEDHAV
jgi:hypothetical protein